MESTKKCGNNSKLENVPEQLIHHLMHFLPCKDATKVSILSRDFYSHWLSFPVLEFNYDFFRLKNDSDEKFFSFIRRIIELRGPHISGSLQKLIFSYHEEIKSTKIYPYLAAFDALLNFAAQNNCKEIIFEVGITVPYYIILEDMSVLNKNVSYIKLLPLFSSNFLKVLKLIGLKFSPIADTFITCENLEELVINSCEGFRTINVSSPSLKKVEVKCCIELVAFQVEGERLESFIFEDVRNNARQPCDVNLPVCDSMKYLHLTKVKVLAGDINEVVTEFLYLGQCELPQNLQIFNPHIKVLEMESNTNVRNLVLYTHNLESFKFKGSEGQPCTLNISTCLGLRILKLMEVTTITDEWLKGIILGLVCLKEVELINCIMLQKMNFKTVNLEKLTLYGCFNVSEVMLDSPNLVQFNYFGSLTVSPMVILSSKCSGYLVLPRDASDHLLWFQTMLQFLGCFDHFKDLTFACNTVKDMIFPREFVWPDKLPPLYDVKHIRFQAEDIPSKEIVTQLVECLLWLVPKPQTLTLSSFATGKTSLLKFGYRRREEERQVEECCSGVPIKCWKHFVLDVQYEGFDDDEPMKMCLERFFAPYLY